MSKKYQIEGTVGAGYKESAYFNPRECTWETRSMDSARYDIPTLEEAESLLETAMQDRDVSDIKIVELADSVED